MEATMTMPLFDPEVLRVAGDAKSSVGLRTDFLGARTCSVEAPISPYDVTAGAARVGAALGTASAGSQPTQ
jgi:hypothetical protein